MELYVIRHGQSEANAEEKHAGWSAAPLTDRGRAEAEALREQFADSRFDAVYCSDLRRARETADLALPQYEVTETQELREINVGSLTGRRCEDCWRELGKTYADSRSRRDYSAYGGETSEQFLARVGGFMDRIAARMPETAAVAAVCHKNTLYAMLCHVWECAPNPEEVTAPNGSVVHFSFREGKWSVAEGEGIPERPNASGLTLPEKQVQ